VAIPAVVMSHYFDRKIEKNSFVLTKYSQLLVHSLDDNHEGNAEPVNKQKSIMKAELMKASAS